MSNIDEMRKIAKRFGLDKDSVWNCHGTTVFTHAACEKIASELEIQFGKPEIIRNDGNEVVLLVSGFLSKGGSEWSFGEVSSNNNKNAYPFAMAEKRGKDRVILKLAKLSELGVHSDVESDDFNKMDNNKLEFSAKRALEYLDSAKSVATLNRTFDRLEDEVKEYVREDYNIKLEALGGQDG